MQWEFAEPGVKMRLAFTSPQVIVHFDGGGSLTLEREYTIRLGDQIFRGDGGEAPDVATAAALTTLTDDLAVRAWIEDGNHFYLQTHSGYVIDSPGDNYPWESWNFSGPEGGLVVCIPGGDLAIWDPVDRTSEQ